MRFFKPDSKDYVSSFVPQDMNLIYKMKENLDAEAEKTDAKFDNSNKIFNLKPGEKTAPLASNLTKIYTGEAQKITDNLYNGKINEATAGAQIDKLVSHFNNNPEVKTVQYDQQLAPTAALIRSDPDFQKFAIGDGIDMSLESKPWKQVTGPMSFSELQSAYKTYLPGDINAEFLDKFKQIIPKLSVHYDDPTYQKFVDENGNLHIKPIQEGLKEEVISRDQVKAELAPYILNDENSMATKGLQYRAAAHEKITFPGSKYDKYDALDDIANSFLGSFSKKEEIQKTGADKISKAGSGSGSGSGSEGGEPVVRFNTILDDVDNSPTKSTKVNTPDVVALHGGNDNKDGSFNTNVTGKEIFLQLGETAASGPEVEETIKLNKFNDFKIKEGEIKGNTEDELGGKLISRLEKRDPSNQYYHVKDGDGVKIYKNGKIIGTAEGIWEKEKNSGLFPEYQNLVKEAEEKEIDVEDKSLNEKFKEKSQNPDKYQSLKQFSILMKGLSGDRKFVLGADNNAFLNENGDLITKQTLNLKESELELMLPSNEGLDLWGLRNTGWKKLVKELPDLIQPGAPDKDGNPTYNVNTYMMVTNSAAMTSEQMQKNMYSTQDGGVQQWLFETLYQAKKSSVDKVTALKAKYADEKYAKKFEETYGKNKNKFSLLKDEWNRYFSDVVYSPEGKRLFNGQNGVVSIDDLTEAHAKIIEMPESTTQERKDKARVMNQFKTYLTNPDIYKMQQQSGQTGGGTQLGKQSPQSNNPLGM
jgi:hypothetical protein